MKRFLLILAAGLLIQINASAVITLLQKGTNLPVSNGTMFHQWGDVTENLITWHDVRAVNNTGTTTKINMKRYTISVPSTVEDYFCWYVCLGSVVSSTNPEYNHSVGSCFNSNNLDTLNYFSAYYASQGLTGTAAYRYVWFDSNNPNDSAYIDITFHVTPVSVNEVAPVVSMNTYPNPANDVLNLNLENADFNSKLIVEFYDVIGNKVLSQILTSSISRIDVAYLSNGSYICTVVSDKKTILTKRVIISH